MPYITDFEKKVFQKSLREIMLEGIDSAGELNYLITQLCLSRMGRSPLSYANINEIIGVLECAKQEFYRRVAVPYEAKKIEKHGDVYP